MQRISLQSLFNTSLFLYFQKMAQLTFCEALTCFAISIKIPLRIPLRFLPCFHIVQRYHSFYSHPRYSCLCHIQEFQIAREDQIYNWLTKHYFPWQAKSREVSWRNHKLFFRLFLWVVLHIPVSKNHPKTTCKGKKQMLLGTNR